MRFVQEAERVTDPLWTLWKRKESLVSSGLNTLKMEAVELPEMLYLSTELHAVALQKSVNWTKRLSLESVEGYLRNFGFISLQSPTG
jgi:hypothetical protein